jgi:hypothetical protein
MSLEFWLSLLDKQFEYEWRATFSKVFPNSSATEYRSQLFNKLQPIKSLRNRIAHHEPLFDIKALPNLHSDILSIIGRRCAMTMEWTKHHSTFAKTWHGMPNKERKSGRPLIEIASPCTEVTPIDCEIHELIQRMTNGKRRDFVVYRDQDKLRLLVADDLIRWFKASMIDDLVEMRSTLDMVKNSIVPSQRVKFSDTLITTGDAQKIFFDNTIHSKNRPTAIILSSDGTELGDPVAVVFRPDFKF